MRRVRFVAAARREFLAEVIYYNKERAGLGARFTAAMEEATARASAFRLTGSPASKSTRRVFVGDFPFAVVYRPTTDELSYSLLHITLAVPAIGCRVFKIADRVRRVLRGCCVRRQWSNGSLPSSSSVQRQPKFGGGSHGGIRKLPLIY